MTSGLSRREVLRGAGLVVSVVAVPRLGIPAAAFDAADAPGVLTEETRGLLERSALVYISPLRADGSESRCHGEVWFAFDRGDVLISTGRDTWKARALAGGRDRARIWVGDFGRGSDVKDRYRAGPSFPCRAREEKDRAAFDRLVEAFARKYPEEWGRWEPRFKKGFEDGSRVLIRYRPVEG